MRITLEMTIAPTVELNDGNRIPAVGYGTGMVQSDDVLQTIPKAITLGYRHIDTAASYNNESAVGEAIRNSNTEREKLFVTTKIAENGHGYDEAQRAVDESLDKLAMDYVDMCLIHWPLPKRNKYVEAWRGLIEAQKDGKVRSIGVSNFLSCHLDELIEETGVTPSVNQIQLYPGLSRNELRKHHDHLGVVTVCWSPLSLGATTLYFGGTGEAMKSTVIKRLADKYERTTAQVILRWHTQLGLVPVSRSSKIDRLKQNLDSFGFQLSETELAEITGLDDGSQRSEDPLSHGS